MIAYRFLLLLALPTACALADDAPVERPDLSFDTATGAWSFSWWGVDDRTYFIQHTEELGNPTPWQFLPVIEKGSGAPISYGFWLNPQPPRFFLRVKGDDQPAADPYTADFDGDGISNGWEIEHGLDPFDASDSAQSVGGITNLELYQQSLGAGADPETANVSGLLVFTP